MYPNLYFFFKKTLGVEIDFLRFVNTFGFFVAVAFLVAMRVLYKDLQKKEKEGYFNFKLQREQVGLPATFFELLVQFFLGGLLGYKIVGVFGHSSNFNFNPQAYILSSRGSLLGGIVVGLIFMGLRWYEKNKQKLAQPKFVETKIYPKDRINDFLMLAFFFGFLGAKLFHNFENWDTFVKNPIGELLSFGGLTFYGGLICAGIAIIVYLRINKIPVLHVADAFATTMIVAYAIGRLGCQFAGDGDWGVLNSAYISDIDGSVIEATPEQFKQALINNQTYYYSVNKDTAAVRSIRFEGGFLPTWLVAQNYRNNVISEGFREYDCEGNYCYYLPIGVFPTPLYESVLGFIIFGVLVVVRKKLNYFGQLAGLYLILSGMERFLIEKIRVNNLIHIGGLSFTQAELISALLVAGGMVLFLKVRRPELKIKRD